MSIRPLPDEVVAQIKSSTAIVSLIGVVLELLKNSLDAKAFRIDVTVDFVRGGCTVEDDGLGIAPTEFREDGGLGKLYCTSKYQSDEPHLGQHGTFLASLSAMSLLTITSHHHAYRSHNSISFHQSQAIERQLPTAAPNHIYGKHGTRVTVRNLFGNMPVRVKQRSMVMDQRTEHHRLREALKKDTVGLLLGWQDPVSVKIRDGDNKIIVNLNTSNAAAVGDGRNTAATKPRSAHLSSMLHIMTQAGYITIDEWSSWVPASASTTAMSVKGAISLEPSPTKHLQFISFGLRPLSSENGHNALYDQVNRLFALSSFGTVEDDADVDEQEKLRRQSDKRFKSEGYTNRQLKSRKGVDRYPTFHLRISLKDRCDSDLMGDRFIEDESNLQAILDIFSAMIIQWLSVHHFRPKKPYQDLPEEIIASSPTGGSQEYRPILSRKSKTSSSTRARSSIGTPNSRSAATDSTKEQRVAMAPLENPSGKPRQQAFAEWSRIKSGKSNFFDFTTLKHKAKMNTCFRGSISSTLGDTDNQASCDSSQQAYAAFSLDSISRGALGGESATTASTEPQNHIPSATDVTDETVLWTDPSTNKTYLLNARTGCVVPPRRSQSQTNSAAPFLTAPMSSTSKSLRMIAKPAATEPAKTPWLDGLLQNWDNPVFKPSECGIQQISLQDDNEQMEHQRSQHNHARCSHADMHKAFNEAGSSSARLSKEGLRRAQVISQVDRKFILAKMGGSPARSESQPTVEALVLIDQHAADERIRVESLLAGLCNAADVGADSDHQSKLGLRSSVAFVMLEKPLHFVISPREHLQFELHAASFAAWGISYDISSSTLPGSTPRIKEKEACRLAVTALPPSISERCKADPQLLISFLRSAVWKYAESPPLAPAASSDQDRHWVQKIATCPPGLVDMINSRACRSAIMFNDELSLEECKDLVSKLANCVFPFMCAHGRPSMVPIVDLGKISHVVEDSDSWSGVETGGQGSFVKAWKKWRT